MMEGKAAALDRWFEERIALCAQRRQALLADDRGDEATFEKVRANVYDIFRTVLSAAGKARKPRGASSCEDWRASPPAGRRPMRRPGRMMTRSSCGSSGSSWTRSVRSRKSF